jgi:hypothetical protein
VMVITRGVGGVNVSAEPDMRAMLTAATKGVATATTAHAWRSVDTQTLPVVGHILSNATTSDFIKIGVVAGICTDIGTCVSSIDGSSVIDGSSMSTRRIETDLEPVREEANIDLLYTLNVSDSHGMAYCGRVLMDADMRASCAEDSKIPISLHALRNLSGYSPEFDTDMVGIVEIMERAFGGSGVDRVQIGTHGVSLDSSGVKRVFPTDAENPTNHILKSQRNTTLLFDEDHTPSHTITVDSVRALRARPVHQRYLATQGVSIDQVGDGYQFQLVMSCSGIHPETELGSDSPNCVSVANPIRTFSTDEGYAPRQSIVHVFVDGGHFAVNVTHIYNSNAPRSLHLPVYAVMNKLASLNLCSELSIKDAMCNGSMETMHGDDSVPYVILKSATLPLVAVFTSRLTEESVCRCPKNCGCPACKLKRHTSEIHEDVPFSRHLSLSQTPILGEYDSPGSDAETSMSQGYDVSDSDSDKPSDAESALPMAVQLALLRQWG